MKCENCGVELPSGISMCYNCGTKPSAGSVTSSVQICPKCGTRVNNGVLFCTGCGYQMGSPAPVSPLSGASGPSALTGMATPEDVFCTNCGIKMHVADTRMTDKVFCTNCGTAINIKKTIVKPVKTSPEVASRVSDDNNGWFSVAGDL